MSVFTIGYLKINNQISVICAEIGPKPLWNATFTDKLRHDLLLNYDKFARPAQHYNVTSLQFSVRFRHFDTNEFKSTINAYCWLQMVRAQIHCNFSTVKT